MRRTPDGGFNGYVKQQQKRKLWQRIVSTLVCIVVFCTTYALILPAITLSDGTYSENSILVGKNDDLAVKTTGSAVYDPSKDVYNVSLRLDFSLTEAEISAALTNGTPFAIKLPSSISVPSTELGRVYYGKDDASNQAFVYTFVQDTNGVYYIEIEFLQAYVDTMAEGSTADVYIEFNSSISGDALTESGGLDLKFSDGVELEIPSNSITYPDNTTHNYDIDVSKSVAEDKTAGTLTYTITVKSTKGTPDAITLSDILADNGAIPSKLSNLSVTKTVLNSSYQETTSVPTGVTYDYSGGKLDMTLPQLVDDDTIYSQWYTITYTVPVDSIDPGSERTYDNSVTATSTDSTTGETVTDDASVTKTVTNNVLSKTGSFDKETQKITWTIKVNEDGNNIVGYTLTDDMLASADEGSITISPADGATVSNGKITFSEVTDTNNDGTNDSNTNAYTITYTTTQLQTSQTTPVSNSVTLTPPDDTDTPVTDSTTVYVPASGGVNKSFASVDKTAETITWSTTITVPQAGFKAGTQIRDNIGSTTWGTDSNHWFTAAQIKAMYDQLKNYLPEGSFKLEYASNIYGTWTEYSSNIDISDTTKYYAYRITFLNDVASENVNGGAGSFTYTYSTTADFDTVVDYESYQNLVWMNDSYSVASYDYHSHVVKLDHNGNTADTSYTNSDGYVGWYVKVFTTEDVSTLTITDTLPSGVTIVNLGVGADSRSNAKANAVAWVTGTSQTVPNTSVTYINTEENGNLVTTISVSDGSVIPARTTVYIYYECKINDLPGAGESKKFTLPNTVSVKAGDTDYGTDTQTQTITVEKPALVTKTDGNGNTGTTYFTSTDGVVSWYVQVYLTEKANSITVTDTLPTGVTLVKAGASIYMTSAKTNAATITNGTAVGDGDELNWTEQHSVSGSTVTTTISGVEIPADTVVYIYYECSIDGFSVSHGDYELKNTATVKVDDEAYGSEVSQTQVITPQSATTAADIVSKGAYWNDGAKQVEYSVVLNANAEDLDADSDTLTLIDVMKHGRWSNWTINSKLVTSSVKLYYRNADGTKGSEVPSNLWSWVFSDNVTAELLKQDYAEIVNTITATIPDSTALILEYAYDIGITQADSLSYNGQFYVSNSATLYGDSSTTDTESGNMTWQVTGSTAGISSNHVYLFTKVEKGNFGNTLAGAVFAVYVYDENGTDTRLTDSSGNLVTYTSGSNGTFTVSWEDGWFSTDTVYYVKELTAPDGYITDSEKCYYFYFGSGNATVDAPSGAIDLNTAYGNAYVANEPNRTTVTVQKNWDNSIGLSDRPDIQVQLYRVYTPAASATLALAADADSSTSSEDTVTFDYSFVGTNGTNDIISGSLSKPKGTTVTLIITDLYGDGKTITSLKFNGSDLSVKAQTTGKYEAYGNTYTSNIYTYTFSLTQDENSLEGNFSGKVSDADYPDWTFVITYSEPSDSGTTGGDNTGDNTDDNTGDNTDDSGTTGGDTTQTLPTNGEAYGDVITLSDSNDWTHAFGNLPLYEYDTDGTTILGYYSYYVKELTTGYVTTYSTYSAVTGGTITITNAAEETDDTTSITVTKGWKDANGNTITNPPVSSITVNVYHTNASGSKVLHGSYELTAGNGWTLNLTGLHTKDSSGSALTYSVEEAEVPDGYNFSVNYTTDSETGVITAAITNTKRETTTVTVTKLWKLPPNGSAPVTSITVDVYRVIKDSTKTNAENAAAAEYYTTATITPDSSGNWVLSLDLTKTDANGNEYTYYVREQAVDGYSIDYHTAYGEVTNGSMTITNTPSTSIKVVKKWGFGTTEQDVTMELYQILSSTNTVPTSNSGGTCIRTITLGANQDEGWDKTWKNLDLYQYDESGNVTGYYFYYVVETTTGFTTTYSNSTPITSGTVTVTNSDKTNVTDITVNKVWQDIDPDTVTMQLYQVFNQGYDAALVFADTNWWPQSLDNSVSTPVVGAGTYTLTWTPSEASSGISTFSIDILNAYAAIYGKYAVTGVKVYADGIEVTVDESQITIDADPPWKDPDGDGVYTETNDLRINLKDALPSDLTFSNNLTVTFTLLNSQDSLPVSLECGNWWSAHTQGLELSTVEKTITFKSLTAIGEDITMENWYCPIWVLFTGDTSTVGGSNYLEYWVQRLDNWGWTTAAGYYGEALDGTSENLSKHGIDYVSDASAADWDNLQTLLQAGIDVTVTAKLDGTGNAVITMGGAGITTTVTLPVDTSKPVYLSLTGQYTTLSEISLSDLSLTTQSSVIAYGDPVRLTESYQWTNLPQYVYDSNENLIGYYTYYVVETTTGYTVTYSNDAPVSGGTITVTNAEGYRYELPETGGGGMILYTLGGAALCCAAVLMYNHKKGRKGARSP